MKSFAFLTLFVFFGLVAAWSKEGGYIVYPGETPTDTRKTDYEIFGLQNDVATNEGANVTFYGM